MNRRDFLKTLAIAPVVAVPALAASGSPAGTKGFVYEHGPELVTAPKIASSAFDAWFDEYNLGGPAPYQRSAIKAIKSGCRFILI